MLQHLKIRRKAPGFAQPVFHQTRRTDYESRESLCIRTTDTFDQRQRLKGFTQAHLIRQNAAEFMSIQMPQPGDPNALVHAAMPKVFSSELSQRICETAADILGGTALLGSDAEHAPAGGEIEQMLRTSIMYVVGGGTNEIQRTIIAQRGLGLGRS